MFKAFFALHENWRPRQAPLSPRPCYGPASGKRDGWIVSFGLQRQPRVWDHLVISECKESVQVSPKVKSAIPKLGSWTGLVNVGKVNLG
jgi:hypothetical protein